MGRCPSLMRTQVGGVCLATVFLAALAAAANDATIVVVNARVWTGNSRRPWAEAVAASGERILAVGSNAEIRALSGASTRMVDGRGGMLTPGFIDSHIHLFVFGRATPFPPIFLRFLRNRQEVAERIRAYAAKLPKGAWILGDGWIDSLWGGQLPSRGWLDELAPDHPVWLVNEDANIGIANGAALQAAGIASVGGPGAQTVISGGPPAESLEMALDRAAPDGTRITLDEALRAFTVDAAYAEFAEKEKGSLEAGKLADFVLFDRDFSRGPAHGMSAAKVRMTVIGGRVAYE
jgi:predicted amidohydrolase YtcJ